MDVATNSSAAEAARAKRPRSLRMRIALSVSAVLLLLILAQSLALLSMYEDMEQDFIDSQLDEQLAYSIAAARTNPALALPNTPTLRLFRLYPDQPPPADLPPEYLALTIGNHEVMRGKREFHVGVREIDGVRYILSYDESEHEERERAATVAVLGGAFTVAVLGFWLVLLTVTRLTRGLDTLAARVGAGRGDQPYAHTNMEPELAAIAAALDEADARQREVLARERDFSSHLAHELRTPLAGIRSDAELIAAVPALPESAQRRAARIVAGADRITALAESLLLLARDARPQLVEAVALRAAIEEVWDELGKERSVRAELEVTVADSALVQADAALLRLVLRNVLDNAVRHGEGSAIRCTLEASRFAVLDRGPGFGALGPNAAFERFARSGAGGGSGLGLALVRHIGAACGWQVSARERSGGGACVQIDFGASLQP